MSNSLLSFILPVHEPDFILFDKVLKALATQSLKEWEAVFVLDGENVDAEKAILRAMKKVQNEFKIVTIPHGGAQKARNEGRKHIKGNYVCWFDSDCVIEPHTAKAWVEQLDANPEAGFIYSGYQFLNEMGAIDSEPFDPWTLKVRNYISACFPVRVELAPEWDESLESAQDWDFWLGVVKNGGKGMFLPGYAFSTAFPTPKSISGKGCLPEVWLERQDKVKAKHGIPNREVCVTSLHERLDGLALAKAIGADYQDHPNDKPNHYKTILQIGFSIKPGEFERCASVWGKQHEKIIFWTADDVESIYSDVSLKALEAYGPRINQLGRQYVEDKRAKEIMTKAGFNVSVLPLPVISSGEPAPLPDSPKFLCDVAPGYGHVFNAIVMAIPDISLTRAEGTQDITKYTGLICFREDRLVRPSVKRALAAGRKVISNIQAPFTGYTDDRVSNGQFMRDFVGKIRYAAKEPQYSEAIRYWTDPRRVERVKEVLK